HHGGAKILNEENLDALKLGLANLDKHIENMKKFNLPVVVAINKFVTDTDAEISLIKSHCKSLDAPVALCEVWAKGGEGGEELAKLVLEKLEENNTKYKPLYNLDLPIKDKISKICTEIYGANGVTFSGAANKIIKQLEELGYGSLPICMSKTQKSISDKANLLGRPNNFTVEIDTIKLAAGAGFIIAMAGGIIDMPGLPKVPAAELIDIDEHGVITGLF
ncbi:MAG: formate--tetrahydrofolate ligase, partial [Cetobacterium sp.]